MARLSLSQLFVLASIPSVCFAFILPGFAPATSTYSAANWSPNPTAAPVQAELELFKRQNSFSVGADGFNTTVVANIVCGYIGKQWSLGATCSASSSCFWDQNSQIVGCCTTEGPCTSGIYTGCYDGTGVKGKDSPYVYTCAGTSVCYLNTYIGTSRSTYHQYGCGNANMSTTIWQTFSDMPDTVTLPIHYTSFNYGGGAAVSSSSSSSSSATPTPTPTSTPTPTPAPKKKSHTGAIVGGVVGGLAGLAIVAALAIFCLRRHRASKTPLYQPETTYVAAGDGNAEKHPPSPYNPHHSYATSQGATTLVSPPHSPQPPSEGVMGSMHGGYHDSPRSDHIGTYNPHLSGQGSEVGSDYAPNSAFRTYSPGNDGYGQQPQTIQEIGGTGVEPRYEMEHTESEIVRKPVGSPDMKSR